MITYKLSEIARSTKGKKPKSVSKEKTDGFKIPYVDIKAFEKGLVDNYTDGENCTFCKPDDVLIVWDGARCGFVGRGVEGAIGSTLAKISSEKYTNDFLFYFLQSKYKVLNSNPRGVGIPHIEPNLLWNFEIPDVNKTTQHAIVSRIESLFAELDKAAEHLRTAQQQLKTYRQAVLNHWLNNEDGKWEMVPIKEIISVISNGSTPKADKMFSKGEIQFLKVYNLNFDGSINLSKEPVFIERDTHETLLKRSQTKQGDVLINIVGPPLGKVSIIPEGEKEYNINQAIVMFRPNEFVTSKFLAYYLMSPQVIAWLTSTSKATAGQYNVKVSTCREIMFPKISTSDQQRIVKEIETRLSQAEAAEARIAEALQKTEALQQSILKKAFSGEFDL